MNVTQLNTFLGNIDIYLLDAILKGYFVNKSRVLDIGCGEGRNIIYFMREGYDVYGIDTHSSAIKMCRMVAGSIDKGIDLSHFIEANAATIPYKDEYFDAIISSAVMHFASDENHFMQMMTEAARVLKPSGIFFIRMASDIGLDANKSKNNFSFLLTRELIKFCMNKFNMEKLEPLKSVNVEDSRVMTTLLLRKLK